MRKEPHIHRLRRVAIGATVAGSLLLAGCGALRDDSGRPLTTLNPKGKQAQSIDDLVSPVFWVAGVVFVLVQVGVIYMVIRFRRREDDVDGVDEPVQTHGIPALEWAWTGLPLVVLVALGVLNAKTILDLEKTPDDAIDVEVYGQQWWWEYRYDVDGDDQPDIITANQMVVPAGRHIHLKIRSNDVIHSFWIPQLNGKMDSVPGRTNDWSIEADEPGLYQGTCTEFCGLSHALMRMEVKAVTADEFEAWKDEQLKPAVKPADGTLAAEGWDEFKTNCASCHQVNGMSYKFEKETDGAPDADYGDGQVSLTSGNAPNLTHLLSRNQFAGNLFALHTKDGEVNEAALGSWLRDPAAMKPMAPDQFRGMPNLNLSQDQIDKLVAYLSTLK